MRTFARRQERVLHQGWLHDDELAHANELDEDEQAPVQRIAAATEH